LDEPFRFVSDEYQPAVADLMEEMADKLGIQFIIVTHEENLKIGNVIKL
jgi:DNA repair exonuclease SbcCD ATPase subunit